MDTLAVELNTLIEGTVIPRLLSDLGHRMYFPKGIVAQATEASRKATRFNASVGMAYQDGHPMTLPIIRELTGNLPTEETVAYAPTSGVAELREVWQTHMVRKNPLLHEVLTTRPAVVPGLTTGLSVVADLFAEPRDVLLLPDLYWGNYRLMFTERRQTQLREYQFFTAEGAFNRTAFVNAARSAAETGKLVVLFNFPNNPAGFSPTTDDVQFIKSTLTGLAESVPVLAICDDAYFGLFYEQGVERQSIFAHLANAHKNLLAIKVDGATKEDYVWGFRVGFVTFAFQGMTEVHRDALEQKLAGIIRSTVSNSSRLSQSIVLRALQDRSYEAQKGEAYRTLLNRYHTMRTVLQEQKRTGRAPDLVPLPCNSGYFMSYACQKKNAEEIRVALLERGIGTISMKGYLLRVAYAGVDAEHIGQLYEEIFEVAESLS